MSVIAWGKPKIEVSAFVGGVLPATPSWTEFPVVKENSALLTTTKGTKLEAKGEGGEIVDIRYGKNAYQFVCEVFVKKDDDKPITDVDGVVLANYAVRLTPEDDTVEGFLLDKTSVSLEESWSSADGKLWKYTFEGMQPETGNILKPYTATP